MRKERSSAAVMVSMVLRFQLPALVQSSHVVLPHAQKLQPRGHGAATVFQHTTQIALGHAACASMTA